jgi:outer membrane protein assembly factor BamB
MATVSLFVVSGCGKTQTETPSDNPPQKAHVSSPPPYTGAPSGPVNVLTYHDDNARTGENANETVLKPSNVNPANFGKVGFLSVQGLVDAEPLYVSQLSIGGAKHNVIFVVTEHDLAYAFDADTFQKLWQVSLLGPDEAPSDNRGCGQVTPEIGVTATPVIDLHGGSDGAMYVVAMSKDSSGKYFQRLHALDLTTGAELNSGPETVEATFPGVALPNSNGQVDFDAKQYKERSSLLLLDGVVYTSWASHCDYDPYSGWVIGFDAPTLKKKYVLNTEPNGSEGAFWMSGAGPAVDEAGYIYLLAGNGTFDTNLDAHGFPDKGDFGNAFLKLGISDGKLAVADYFDMHNTVPESRKDLDLGSGGTLVLPDMTDTSGKGRHLAVGAGKDDIIYLVDRDSMGKFNPDGDQIYQEVPSTGSENSTGLGGSGGVYSMPAYFNGTLYYGAVDDHIRAFKFDHARIVTPAASMTSITFGYPGATPSISSDGENDGIVWAVENNTPAVLHAYDANNLARELYNSNQQRKRDEITGNKFITPMVAAGKVYVGTPNGVAVFGLLPKETQPQQPERRRSKH